VDKISCLCCGLFRLLFSWFRSVIVCFGWSFVCFGLTENTETHCFDIKAKQQKQPFLFRIVQKLVSVPVSVVSNRNWFEGHPSPQVDTYTEPDYDNSEIDITNLFVLTIHLRDYKNNITYSNDFY
jgi:hypothetical protein